MSAESWSGPPEPRNPGVPYFEHPRRVLSLMYTAPDGLLALAARADQLELAAVCPADVPTREALYAAVRIATALAERLASATGRRLGDVLAELSVELEASIPIGDDPDEPPGGRPRS